jgi:hypothetical protein
MEMSEKVDVKMRVTNQSIIVRTLDSILQVTYEEVSFRPDFHRGKLQPGDRREAE